MNGAVYISFFQGQLESVLEQVVQLAVQEISKSVGSSLNTLLLETAVKEQENRRLKLQLQARESRGRAGGNPADSGGSPAAGKHKAGKAAGDERADSGRTKPEQRQQEQLHAPGGQGTEPGIPTDTRRLEQRGRVVGSTFLVFSDVAALSQWICRNLEKPSDCPDEEEEEEDEDVFHQVFLDPPASPKYQKPSEEEDDAEQKDEAS